MMMMMMMTTTTMVVVVVAAVVVVAVIMMTAIEAVFVDGLFSGISTKTTCPTTWRAVAERT